MVHKCYMPKFWFIILKNKSRGKNKCVEFKSWKAEFPQSSAVKKKTLGTL